MNKYQEVFTVIADDMLVDCPEYKITGNGCSCKEQHKCRNKLAVDLIKELVDKATPKKPTEDKIQDVYYITKYTCPTCGGKFTGAIAKYCCHCGQALDWSEE